MVSVRLQTENNKEIHVPARQSSGLLQRDLDVSSPLDPVLGRAVLQHQPLVAFLQVSCCQVQLLINFGMLVVHLPQEIHLLGQVLREADTSLQIFVHQTDQYIPP